jgi:hypothetical protein
MKRLTSVALIFASACAFSTPHARDALVAATPRVHIDEKAERAWIGVNGRARVIELGGDERLGTTLTIHGINAAPNDVALLSNAALARGERTLTIAYDDNFRRLQNTADDFARHVEAAQSMLKPQTRLRIDAHSMGARAIVVALDRMQRAGRLTGDSVDLHLIAPLLRGIRAANQTWMMPLLLPFGLSSLVKNAEPARDLAQSSEFQRELEAARFPAQVRVAITLAEHDRFASKDATTIKLAERWRASVLVLPGTTHLSILSAASSHDHMQLGAAPAHSLLRTTTTYAINQQPYLRAIACCKTKHVCTRSPPALRTIGSFGRRNDVPRRGFRPSQQAMSRRFLPAASSWRATARSSRRLESDNPRC